MQFRYVLKKAILTEKSAWLMERRNVYTFEIPLEATKQDVKIAVEAAFGVTVERVRTMRRQSVSCRFKGRLGMTADSKRALVELLDGDSIVSY